METVKYIIKRLLLSILILFGVSVIIFALSRMLPTDFIDQKYSSALAQGTITQEDVDEIKEIYGLFMPEAYLSAKMDSDDYADNTFERNAKLDDYERVSQNVEPSTTWYTESDYPGMNVYQVWYVGTYDDGNANLRLEINSDGTYAVYYVESRGVTTEETDSDSSSSDSDSSTLITLDEILTLREEGKYTVSDTGVISFEKGSFTRDVSGKITSLDSFVSSGESGSIVITYREASFWDKAGTVLSSYFNWLVNMLQGDFGISFKYNKPVGEVIFENMGISFTISFIATILQFLIAIPLGIKAATHQYGVVDYTVTILSMIGISLPTFFLANLFIRLFGAQLGWFPTQGLSSSLPTDATWITRILDNLWHMVMPMTVLVILSIGGLMRYTRTNTLEVLNADYIRTARAKGVSEHDVIYKHAFRNTLIPLVTMLAGILPSLFSGAMITEQVFSIPGVGKKAYDALVAGDIPFIMGYNMFMAVLTVIGTLFSDLMYAVVDPRVKLGR